MSKPDHSLRIGEVSRESGVSVKAIRYYETLGLLSPTGRSPAGYRLYRRDVLDRLQFVRQAQALGLGLRNIGGIIRIRDGGQAPCEHVRGLVDEQIAVVDAKLEQLANLRSRLVALASSLNQVDTVPPAVGVVCPCLQANGDLFADGRSRDLSR
jgi:DNA-binding transcriptional MerR regulator